VVEPYDEVALLYAGTELCTFKLALGEDNPSVLTVDPAAE
jgi:hypothetical protein